TAEARSRIRSRRDISCQTCRRIAWESWSISTTSAPTSCAVRAAASISSPTSTPYWRAIRTWNRASRAIGDRPRDLGIRLTRAWYRTGSSSSATTLGRRARISARMACPMSNTCPTPRRVIMLHRDHSAGHDNALLRERIDSAERLRGSGDFRDDLLHPDDESSIVSRLEQADGLLHPSSIRFHVDALFLRLLQDFEGAHHRLQCLRLRCVHSPAAVRSQVPAGFIATWRSS